MSRRTLDRTRGLWRWCQRGTIIFAMTLIICIGQLSHYDGNKNNDEPVKNITDMKSFIAEESREDSNQDYLDYDMVFANTSTFEFPLMVFSTVGRLGNCLCSYATALTFAGRFNATIAVTEAIFKTVSNLLSPQHLSLPVVSNELITDAYDMGVLVNVQPDYINDDMVSHLVPTINKAVKRYQLSNDQMLYVLEGYPNRMKLLANHHGKIRQNFQIHKHLRKKASSFLQKIRLTRGSDVTFIGFHIRQGDYPKFMKGFFHCEMPDKNFYSRALNYYRSIFTNPVFVICTDDKAYAKNHFADAKDVIISDFTHSEEDFALLAECSHSIMTVGSFGFWGSYLAGGEVLYPLIRNCSKLPFMHPSTIGEIGYKNWMALDT